jgi:adenine-specific DNA-methyltransferase
MTWPTTRNSEKMSRIQQISPEEVQLVRSAIDLGAVTVGGQLSREEERLVALAQSVDSPGPVTRRRNLEQYLAGNDLLGEALVRLRTKNERRLTGTFYTPPGIAKAMVLRIMQDDPTRVVDAGCGSGRFAAEVARTSHRMPIVAVDLDPVATLLTRAALRVAGAKRAVVLNADYTRITLPKSNHRTAFVSNPPYVRHHSLGAASKAWAIKAGRRLGVEVSSLSGLHVHFLLATALSAEQNDIGCFITGSEWLDVRYGGAVRELFLEQLGLESIDIVDPKALTFADVMTTASICYFRVGARFDCIRVRRVSQPHKLKRLGGGDPIRSAKLAQSSRWGPLIRRPTAEDEGKPKLGEVFRVHRGLVTGANRFFVMRKEEAHLLGVEPWSHPAVTGADEVLKSGGSVQDAPDRRVLVALPGDIDRREFPAVGEFLRQGEHRNGKPSVSQRYVARHRNPWWYLGRLPRPPIVVTYMARRPPFFALNPDGLVILNIAHGLYPKNPLTEADLRKLVAILNDQAEDFIGMGRTYQGGLEKFEPKEMEGLPLNGAYAEWRVANS